MAATRHQALGLAAMAERNGVSQRPGNVGPRPGFGDPDAGGAGENWRARAECAKPERDADAWFPVGATGPAMLQIQDAKDVCNGLCPVREQCAAFALAAGMADGVWGGLSEDDRKTLRRREARRRQREAS